MSLVVLKPEGRFGATEPVYLLSRLALVQGKQEEQSKSTAHSLLIDSFYLLRNHGPKAVVQQSNSVPILREER